MATIYRKNGVGENPNIPKSTHSDSLSENVLETWQGAIMEGLFKRSGTQNGSPVIGYPSDRISMDGGGSVISRSSSVAQNYDFDARARALNKAKHPKQPNTATKYGRGVNTTGFTIPNNPGGQPIIPMNQAIRDVEDMVTNFDVSRLPDYDNMATNFCGHLLFSRPSLYLQCTEIEPADGFGGYTSSDSIWVADPIKNYYQFAKESLTAAFAGDRLGITLLHPLTQFSANPYMPLFTTKALTYSTADISIKTIEKGQTFYGHTIKYGHYSEDHKAGGSITIEFLNDRYWSILKTCYMWMAYIHMVSKSNAIRPSLNSQTNGILDYCGSIYYLVTDMDNHRLVYWEKLTGVFPKLAPFSLFSTEDNPKVEDKVSIEFDYGIKSDPCDPSVLLDINMLTYGNLTAAESSGFGGQSVYSSGAVDPNAARQDGFRGGIMARGNIEAARPVIRRATLNSNKYYYLDWLTTSPAISAAEYY